MSNQQKWIDRAIGSRILQHLLFWGVAVFSSALIKNLYYPSFSIALGETLILLPAQLGAAYFLVYYQLPLLIMKRRFGLFVISVVLGVYVFTVIGRVLTVHLIEELWRPGVFEQESIGEILIDLPHLLKAYFFRVYSASLFMAIIKLILDRLKGNQKHKALEKEKIETELKFLKAQIHPHFLFNTLNNLYALTLQKSDKAPETVLKLSEMMDYMLYQSKNERVPISKEVALVRNYIDLELLRYGDRLSLDFDVALDDETTLISPLIFLSLVENAFKHGASGSIEHPHIKIDLVLSEGELKLKVFNTRRIAPSGKRTGKNGGIGGANLKRQLELIYPKRYRIETEEHPDTYEVNLYIDLNAPVE